MITVGEAEYADFFLWTSNFFKVDRIQPDTSFSDTIMDVVPKFWVEHCLPELLTRGLEHRQAVSATRTEKAGDDYEYCYCKFILNHSSLCCSVF